MSVKEKAKKLFEPGDPVVCPECGGNRVETFMREQGSLDRASFVARCVNDHWFYFVVPLVNMQN